MDSIPAASLTRLECQHVSAYTHPCSSNPPSISPCMPTSCIAAEAVKPMRRLQSIRARTSACSLPVGIKLGGFENLSGKSRFRSTLFLVTREGTETPQEWISARNGCVGGKSYPNHPAPTSLGTRLDGVDLRAGTKLILPGICFPVTGYGKDTHMFSRVRWSNPSGLALGISHRCIPARIWATWGSSPRASQMYSARARVSTRPVGSLPWRLPTYLK